MDTTCSTVNAAFYKMKPLTAHADHNDLVACWRMPRIPLHRAKRAWAEVCQIVVLADHTQQDDGKEEEVEQYLVLNMLG